MSMREKYQSLALADLKEIAKSRGIKGTSGMKKADIIEAVSYTHLDVYKRQVKIPLDRGFVAQLQLMIFKIIDNVAFDGIADPVLKIV